MGDIRKSSNQHLEDSRENASLYVGESSRSLFERSAEHIRDYKLNKDDSHMFRHWKTSHNSSTARPN